MRASSSERSARRFVVILGALALFAAVVAVVQMSSTSHMGSPEGVAFAVGAESPTDEPSPDESKAADPPMSAQATLEVATADDVTLEKAAMTDEEWAAVVAVRPDRPSPLRAVSSSGLDAPDGVAAVPDHERLSAEDVPLWQPSWVHENLPATRWPMDLTAPALRTVYVTCDIESSTAGTNVGLVKYVDGEQVWIKSYDGPAHGDDLSGAVAARGSALYTAAARQIAADSEAPTDLVVSRWDPSGKRLWTRVYDSGDRGWEFATDCAIDSAGNLIVAAESMSRAGFWDWVVISYKPDGTRRWVRRYDGPLHDIDLPVALRVDSAKNIYVAGASVSGNEQDVVVIKYSATGTRLWARRYNGVGDDVDFAQDLRLRPGGGVYVAGVTWGEDSKWYGLLLSYKADGTKVFALEDAGTGWESAGGWFDDLEVTPEGTVLCGGAQYVADVGWQWSLVEVSSGGAVLSREVEPSPAGSEVMRMAKDSQGGVYAAGVWMTDESRLQFRTQRRRAGGVTWRSVWPAEGDLVGAEDSDFVQGITVNGVNVYVLGMRWVPPTLEFERGYYSQCLMGYVY